MTENTTIPVMVPGKVTLLGPMIFARLFMWAIQPKAFIVGTGTEAIKNAQSRDKTAVTKPNANPNAFGFNFMEIL